LNLYAIAHRGWWVVIPNFPAGQYC
jgi:hypothetical protein